MDSETKMLSYFLSAKLRVQLNVIRSEQVQIEIQIRTIQNIRCGEVSKSKKSSATGRYPFLVVAAARQLLA